MLQSLTSKFLFTALGTACLSVGTAMTAMPAIAGTITYNGTTLGQPTFHRPKANGINAPVELSPFTAVPYSVQSFSVDTSGQYDLISGAIDPPGWDNYLFLYQNSFNPIDPLANGRIANNNLFDLPIPGFSGFTNVALNAGVTYFLVTAGFENSDFGAFTNFITGPGEILLASPTPIPTPALLPGLVGFGVAIWRKKRNTEKLAQTHEV